MTKNIFGKTAKVDAPYAIFKAPQMNFEWRVLKTYQRPDKEMENQYARWFVAARSDMTYGSWEYGDTYVRDIVEYGTLVEAVPQWYEQYGD